MNLLDRYLGEFSALASAPGAARAEVPFTATHDGGEHSFHLVFGSMIHGDEVGSLPGVLSVLRALRSGALKYGGSASFFVGNPPAGRAGRRFLEADLNRVFTDAAPDSAEKRRADDLRRLLDRADLFIDLHQTGLPSAHPFFVLPWRPQEERWIRALAQGSEVWMTRAPDQTFSPGKRCGDEYVRDRGAAALTLELGERGFRPEAAALAEAILRAALALGDAIARGETTLEQRAAERPLPPCFEEIHVERFPDPALSLRPGLVNFQPVQAGEVVSAPGTPPLEAPRDGVLIFPKYPARDASGRAIAPWPDEIYRLARRMEQPPEAAWGSRLAGVDEAGAGG